MTSVGVRELKQNASEVVARAERGEEIDITLRGRPVARMVPTGARKRSWVPAAELAAALGEAPESTGWLEEQRRSRDDDPLTDPWEQRA